MTKRKANIKRILIWVFLSFIIILGTIYLLLNWLTSGISNLQEIDIDAQDVSDVLIPITNDEDKPINILLLGVDTIGGLSDTIVFGTYDPESNKMLFISIPRDTLVDIRDISKYTGNPIGVTRINQAYHCGGISLALKTVSALLGVDIHYYVRMNYEGLDELIDMVGGVPIDIDYDMDYDDKAGNLHIHMSKGSHILDADHAKQYLRWRKNNDGSSDGKGDIGRIERQQKFMNAFLTQFLQPKNLNISSMIKLRDILSNSLSTNLQLFDETLWDILIALRTLNTDNSVDFITLFGEYYGNYWRSNDFYLHNTDKLLNDFWGISQLDKELSVEVVCGNEEKAAEIMKIIIRRFPSLQICTKSESSLLHSQIVFEHSEYSLLAKEIAYFVHIGDIYQCINDVMSDNPIQIIIGDDIS